MKIESLNEIELVIVHWSESEYINIQLGDNEDGDIEKEIDAAWLDKIIKQASSEVDIGYDKTVLTIKLKNGKTVAFQEKFYLTPIKDSLLKLINNN